MANPYLPASKDPGTSETAGLLLAFFAAPVYPAYLVSQAIYRGPEAVLSDYSNMPAMLLNEGLLILMAAFFVGVITGRQLRPMNAVGCRGLARAIGGAVFGFTLLSWQPHIFWYPRRIVAASQNVLPEMLHPVIHSVDSLLSAAPYVFLPVIAGSAFLAWCAEKGFGTALGIHRKCWRTTR